MIFNATQFLADYGIDWRTETEGWANITCPFCSDTGKHLGLNISRGYANCFRCGWHPLPKVIKALINVTPAESYNILRKYPQEIAEAGKSVEEREAPSKIELPRGCRSMGQEHKKYLMRRGFDPSELKRIFRLRGTRHYGPYRFRIIAPIYLGGQLVSYQGRDITDRADLKYKACSKKNEIIHHKDILYALDLVPGDTALVFEGIADVWRFGPGAVGTFGADFTRAQVECLAFNFRKLFIIYDSEEQAQKQAEKMAKQLAILKRESEILTIDEGDPASMSQKYAQALKNELLKTNKTKSRR